MVLKRRFYIEDFQKEANCLSISGEEFDHLKVLRPKIGMLLEVVNGQGQLWQCEIKELHKAQANIKVLEKNYFPKSVVNLTMAIALSREKTFEEILEPLSEIGVTHIQPFISERSLHSWEDHAKWYNRWQRLLIQSLKQSKRWYMMKICPVLSFREFASTISNHSLVVFGNTDGKSPLLYARMASVKNFGSHVMGIVGPEGGFAQDEIESLMLEGAHSVSLGDNILKINTAGITMAAFLQAGLGVKNELG